jgi:uroporphyrinogen-III synthase
MHLLVTRPEPDGEDTAVRLRALGHTVTLEPMLTIALAEPPADLPEPFALVLTSRNGVRAMTAWPQSRQWRDKPLLAGGRTTADAARSAGFRDVHVGGGDAAQLAELVREILPRGRGPILYPAARDRAGALSAGLLARGYDMRTVEAYRADKVPAFSAGVRGKLERGEFDGALFYSRRTAQTFRELCGTHVVRLPLLFALSEQIAAALVGLDGEIRVAAAPDEASLFALIAPT